MNNSLKNKTLDKYIKSKIGSDESNNNTLNTSYKSINSLKPVKLNKENPCEEDLKFSKIKEILRDLVNEAKNQDLIFKEFDKFYKTLKEENTYKPNNIINNEIENLKIENKLLKRKLDDHNYNITKITKVNEELNKQLNIKTKQSENMQRTLFQFQNELNSFTKPKIKPVKKEEEFSFTNIENKELYYLPKKVLQ
jgi:hypothetical protein